MTNNQPSQLAADTIINLEDMIKNSLQSLTQLKDEMKKEREMLADTCDRDAIFHEKAEKAKEATKLKMETKKAINANPAVAKLSEKMKFLRNEIKERQQLLSDYAAEYQKLTGANEITDNTGETLEIVNHVSLVRKPKAKFSKK